MYTNNYHTNSGSTTVTTARQALGESYCHCCCSFVARCSDTVCCGHRADVAAKNTPRRGPGTVVKPNRHSYNNIIIMQNAGRGVAGFFLLFISVALVVSLMSSSTIIERIEASDVDTAVELSGELQCVRWSLWSLNVAEETDLTKSNSNFQHNAATSLLHASGVQLDLSGALLFEGVPFEKLSPQSALGALGDIQLFKCAVDSKCSAVDVQWLYEVGSATSQVHGPTQLQSLIGWMQLFGWSMESDPEEFNSDYIRLIAVIKDNENGNGSDDNGTAADGNDTNDSDLTTWKLHFGSKLLSVHNRGSGDRQVELRLSAEAQQISVHSYVHDASKRSVDEDQAHLALLRRMLHELDQDDDSIMAARKSQVDLESEISESSESDNTLKKDHNYGTKNVSGNERSIGPLHETQDRLDRIYNAFIETNVGLHDGTQTDKSHDVIEASPVDEAFKSGWKLSSNLRDSERSNNPESDVDSAFAQVSSHLQAEASAGVAMGFILEAIIEGLHPNAYKQATQKLINLANEYLVPLIEDYMAGMPPGGAGTPAGDAFVETSSETTNDGGGYSGTAEPLGALSKLVTLDLLYAEPKITSDIASGFTTQLDQNLHNSVSETSMDDLQTWITDHTANEVASAVPQVLSHTVPAGLKRLLPPYLLQALANTLTNTLTRSLTHSLNHVLTHAMTRNPQYERACYDCKYFNKNCEGCGRGHDERQQHSNTFYVHWLSAYYSDYYSVWFTRFEDIGPEDGTPATKITHVGTRELGAKEALLPPGAERPPTIG
jgi:hypothetical protein